MKLCLFNHNLSLIQKQNVIQRNTGLLFENMYKFYCTNSIKTNILAMLGTGYFLKIAKKKIIKEIKKSLLIAKIDSRKNFVPHGNTISALCSLFSPGIVVALKKKKN